MATTHDLRLKVELGKMLVDDALLTTIDSEKRKELFEYKRQLNEMEYMIHCIEMLETFESKRSTVGNRESR